MGIQLRDALALSHAVWRSSLETEMLNRLLVAKGQQLHIIV